MGLSVLGFQQAASWGWDSRATWACIVGGLLDPGHFRAGRAAHRVPLIKVRIFRDRAFAIDNAVLFFAMIAFVPVFFFASVYSQVSLGYDASSAGLYLLIFFAGFAVASQFGGRMLDAAEGSCPSSSAARRRGGVRAVGLEAHDLSEGSQWPYIVVAGAGIGLLLGPASTDAVNRAINASYGEVTGITQTLRNYGSSGPGGAGRDPHQRKLQPDHRVPDRVRTAAGAGPGGRGLPGSSEGSGSAPPVPPALRQQVYEAIQLDFAQACQVVFYGMAIALGIALVFALFHPGGKVTDHPPADEGAATVPAADAA